MSKKLTTEEFIEKVTQAHGNKYDYSLVNYISNSTEIDIICSIHGIFRQQPKNHFQGKGCLQCSINTRANKRRKTLNEFLSQSKNIHSDKYDYSFVKYKNDRTKVEIICKKHGSWLQKPGDHLMGKGCPICKESRGEKETGVFLSENNIKFIREKIFLDCKNVRPLPFDFYLPDFNICIEYDGEQHFFNKPGWGGRAKLKEIKKRDKIKTNYCIINNILLIRISFKENVIDILTNQLLSKACRPK